LSLPTRREGRSSRANSSGSASVGSARPRTTAVNAEVGGVAGEDARMLATARSRVRQRAPPKRTGSMVEGNNNTGNLGGQQANEGAPQMKARVLGQYIKDLSFENPNVRKLFGNPGSQPNVRVEVSVNANNMREKLFESTIQFKAEASNDAGVLYDL